MADPEMYAELISDSCGVHVHSDLQRMIIKNKGINRVVSHTNCGIAQAFVMASLNPANIIGMDSKIGSIEPCKIADLVFVDDKLDVKQVILEGEICKF